MAISLSFLFFVIFLKIRFHFCRRKWIPRRKQDQISKKTNPPSLTHVNIILCKKKHTSICVTAHACATQFLDRTNFKKNIWSNQQNKWRWKNGTKNSNKKYKALAKISIDFSRNTQMVLCLKHIRIKICAVSHLCISLTIHKLNQIIEQAIATTLNKHTSLFFLLKT